MLPNKARAAINGTFTNPGHSATMHPMLSADGGGIQLSARKSEYRAFISETTYNSMGSNGSLPITFTGICRGGYTIYYGTLSGNSISRNTDDNGGCAGGNLTLNIPKGQFGQPSKYKTVGGNNVNDYTVNLYVKFADSSSGRVQTFSVSFPSGDVTFDDLGISGGSLSGGYPGGNAFSVMPNDVGSAGFNSGYGSRNEFSLTFGPDCDYVRTRSASDVFLKWYDADVGMQNQASNLYFQLEEFTISGDNRTKVITVSGAELGGNGARAMKNIGTLRPDRYYKWTWHNVNYSNGVQVWVPFSEYMAKKSIKCVEEECPNNTNWTATDPRCYCPTNRSITTIDPRCDDGPTPSNLCRTSVTTNGGSGLYGAPTNAAPPVDGYADSGWRTGQYNAQSNVPRRTYVEIYGQDAGGEVLLKTGYVGTFVRSDGTTYVDNSLTLNYGPNRLVRIRYVGQERILYRGFSPRYDTDGNFTNYVYSADHLGWANTSDTSTTYTCYSATCRIMSVSGSGPNGEVIAGGPIYVTASITNDSGPNNQTLSPTTQGGKQLSITSGNSPTIANIGFENDPPYKLPPLAPGQSAILSFTASNPFTGPAAAPQSYIAAYPDYYYGMGRLGPDCGSAPFSVYAPFTAYNPAASTTFAPDAENPTSAHHVASLCTSRPVYLETSSYATVNGGIVASAGAKTYSGCSNPLAMDLTRDPRPVRAGDSSCTVLSVPYSYGYVGPGGPGDRIGLGGPLPPVTSCQEVHNEPYIHAFNSDVRAGGGFGSACTATGAGIRTYMRPATQGATPVGSGAQYGAIAKGQIAGFSSSILRYNTPQPLGSIGLSLTNTNAVNGNGHNANLGGNFDEPHCVPDYFSRNTDSTAAWQTTGTIAANNGIANGVSKYRPGGNSANTLIINGNTIPAGRNSVVYVDGNVRITGNIDFGAGWSIGTVPSLFLIVKGNIYIDPGVTRLSGVFVAQHDTGNVNSRGSIFTCTESTNGANLASDRWLRNCNNQLVVNGSFVAQHVHLQRSYGSLRNSSAGEKYGVTGAHACEEGVASSDCASEVFIFSPEMYLAQPPFTPINGPNSGKYDYITSLSPVL